MNYRHAFHAGNFADCMKHAVLVWLLRALHRKPAPVFALDTHAGIGGYELDSGPALRTGEAERGIVRLLRDTPGVLADYVGLVRAMDLAPAGGAGGADPGLRHYPGSPALIRALMRPDDRLACCELHDQDAADLRHRFARDPLVGVHHRDGWQAVRALLPPRQKRALVLIDPPFEAVDEFARLAEALASGWERCRTGVFAAWYPIKHRAPVRAFHAAIRQAGIRDVVAAELLLRAPLDPARLNGCGLVVINPPYRFETEVAAILAALLDRLGEGEAGAEAVVTRLCDE